MLVAGVIGIVLRVAHMIYHRSFGGGDAFLLFISGITAVSGVQMMRTQPPEL